MGDQLEIQWRDDGGLEEGRGSPGWGFAQRLPFPGGWLQLPEQL